MPDGNKVILTVDDNATNLTMLNEILSRRYKVYPANSGERALHFLTKRIPDLILLDVVMPGLNGYEVLDAIKHTPEYAGIPVIFLTGKDDVPSEAKAFQLGAVDYIQKPINETILLARVKLHLELELYKKNLEKLVDKRTKQLMNMQDTTLSLLAHLTDYRDKDTGGHIQRTSEYVCCIMNRLLSNELPGYRIDKTFYDNLKKLSPLHDIGKVCIPDSILLKPAKLTDAEFEVMKTHTTSGANLLMEAIEEGGDYSFLHFSHEIVLSHHEKWDGSGYPMGLQGENIPLSGRIMAIADVYDALTTERPYKEAFSHEKSMDIMRDLRGRHFDPVLLDVFCSVEQDIMTIKENLAAEESGEGNADRP